MKLRIAAGASVDEAAAIAAALEEHTGDEWVEVYVGEATEPAVVHEVNDATDADSFFELQPEYGPEILTGFARIDGRPVGVVANQPAHRAGAIFPDAARKAAKFVWKCDAFCVPLLYLCDTPGFMAGWAVEKEGTLEAGKKMTYATSAATVPKQCVVVRKA
jgi:acetyl-CoA carboxylase carboxyltransferase component